MTRIGIISDTHAYLYPGITKQLSKADLILHAGDIGNLETLERLKNMKPVKAVYGNIDGTDIRQECSEYLDFEIEGIKVLMMHIGGYPGKYTTQAREMIRSIKPKLFISGHSHILKIMPDKKNNLLHINPGACGKAGLHKKITSVFLNIHNGEFKDLEVYEKDR
ncbi:MAG: metallophosphatase family protein [Bacteroidales bacterium]|nr:metallophosphatase family protein [Bacteroidales bacterium]MCF8388165.1 metallophosphatase family protein [Bacteroidales bacterium]MCF8399105.1 metallophosphatase family protein [Bacteroidales bacterium]